MYHHRDTFEQLYPAHPARDTLQHVIKAWRKVVWQKAEKTLLVFFFVNELNNAKKKATIFQVIPEGKQQLVEEKDADNIKESTSNTLLIIRLVV